MSRLRSPSHSLPCYLPRFRRGRIAGAATRGGWPGVRFCVWLCLVVGGFCLATETGVGAARGADLEDRRFQPLKDLNGYFPFEPPASRGEWEQRAEALRRRILVATGLWPMPPETPLNAVIHGRTARDGFTVEKVYFESYPGHFVTGLLFRPEKVSGKVPAVLCPHGHGGRLQDHGDGVAKLVAEGQERFEGSGRFPKLARCAQLARMGCVAFIYDMLGYADSQQISTQLAHRFAAQRPEFDTPESWGLYSTQAELRNQSIFGIQTYNSIRALDFLASLPEVDAERLAVTGGSGGGTQTIILGAIDPRPIAAFPQGMVSTAMQGGCTCENTCLLRITAGNVELAGLFAPKPLAMTGANDWTKEIMTKGYPQLQQLYSLYGARDKVFCKPFLHFPHNYNYVTRAVMYSWFNRHLKLGLEEPIVEGDSRPLTKEEVTIWDAQHPQPAGGEQYERALTRQLDEISRGQLAALRPRDQASLARYREVVGGAVDVLIGRKLPKFSELEREKLSKEPRDGYLEFADLVRYKPGGEVLPVRSLYSKNVEWNQKVVLWLHGKGKQGLYDQAGPRREILDLLAKGYAVVGADLFSQGELMPPGVSEPAENRVVKNPRQYAGYTYTYNHPLFAQRVHDILTLVSFIRGDEHQVAELLVVAEEGAGPLAAAARAQAGSAIDWLAIDTEGFRFAQLSSYRHPHFLPGIVKYQDLPGLLALSAPQPTVLYGEQGKVPELTAAAYQAADVPRRIRSLETSTLGFARQVVTLLESR